MNIPQPLEPHQVQFKQREPAIPKEERMPPNPPRDIEAETTFPKGYYLTFNMDDEHLMHPPNMWAIRWGHVDPFSGKNYNWLPSRATLDEAAKVIARHYNKQAGKHVVRQEALEDLQAHYLSETQEETQ